MKAITLQEPGGVENLVIKDIDTPSISENEVLVKVKAIGINPIDIKTRKGKGGVFGRIIDDKPVILGWDISGEVVETGSSVSKFKKGDQVFGMVNMPGHGRAYAEYVAAPEEYLAIKPDSVSHKEAAAASLAAITAYQVLVEKMEVEEGKSILIHAAAGGVGHFAVQIAKSLGLKVLGTSSADKIGFLKEIGVDQPIDYENDPIETLGRSVDYVLDTVGGETTVRSLRILKRGGVLISLTGGVTLEVKTLIEDDSTDAMNYIVHSNGEDMSEIANLLKEGKIKPFISKEYTFDEIPEAHNQIETGRTQGKLVVTL